MACHTQVEIAEREIMTRRQVSNILEAMADLPKLSKSIRRLFEISSTGGFGPGQGVGQGMQKNMIES